MPALSKLFGTNLKYVPCQVVLHPGMSCRESFLHDLLHYISSNMKFYLPFTLIPLLMNIRRADKKLIKDSLLYYAETSLGGYLIGNTITILMCLFRNLLGKYTLLTLGILPSFLSGFWIFMPSDRVARFYSVSVAQIVLEEFLYRIHGSGKGIPRGLRIFETLVFMACSAFLLQMIQKHKFKAFWFIGPPPLQQKNKDKTQINFRNESVKCTHKVTCQKYILTGVKEYFLIGFAMENIKILMKKIKHIKSVSDYFRQINLYAIMFLLSYVGVYRLSYCLLNRYSDIEVENVHLLAAYLGGISFIFYPKPIILSYAIILSCESAWRLLKRKQENYPKLVQPIFRFPLGRISFPITLATLVYTFIIHNPLKSKLGFRLIEGATNNRASYMLKNINGELWRCLSSQ